MYKVLVAFTDLQDKNHAYSVGDAFPREGLKVSVERLEELSSASNKRGVALIEKIEEKRNEEFEEMPKVNMEPIPEEVKDKKQNKKKK